LIPTPPDRTRRCGRWTACWPRAWPCAWRRCPRRTIRQLHQGNLGGPAFSQLIKMQGILYYYLDQLCAANDRRATGAAAPWSGRCRRRSTRRAAGLAGHLRAKNRFAPRRPADAVRNEFKKMPARLPAGEEEHPEPAGEEIPRPTPQEAGLLRLLLGKRFLCGMDWPRIWSWIWIAHPHARDIIAWRLGWKRAIPGRAWQGDFRKWTTPLWRNLITETSGLTTAPCPTRNPWLKGSPTRGGVVKNLRDSYIDRQLAGAEPAPGISRFAGGPGRSSYCKRRRS